MQTYLFRKGVCPFTPPIDQTWHFVTRGIDNAINNQKVIGIFFQITNKTIPQDGSITCHETWWLLTKYCCHKNFNET